MSDDNMQVGRIESLPQIDPSQHIVVLTDEKVNGYSVVRVVHPLELRIEELERRLDEKEGGK